jgi:peptide/nickel transport system permease protein
VAVSLKLVPPTSIIPIGASPLSQPSLLVLPVVTLCLAGSAYIVRMLRAGVIESMSSDYVQAARLNGINERRVIFHHALRNSLAPTVQVVALTVQFLIGGVVVVETVFSYPGLGAGLVGAVIGRDIPVVQSVTLLLALVYIVINLIADLVVVLLVPKLRTNV